MSESAQFPVTLEEFCADLSKTDRHVERISMFYFEQKQAGNLRNTVANFQAAYAELSS